MNKNKLLSWEEKASICKKWQESGLNRREFCQQENLSIPTFNAWCRRLWPKESEETENFYPIHLRESQQPLEESPKTIIIDLLLPQSVTARVQASNSQFRFLIQELLHATATIQ